MNIEFTNKELRKLYVEESGRFMRSLPAEVIDEFFVLVGFIVSAKDERDLRAMKSRRFEKLTGRGGEHSMRLNGPWRLIFTKDDDTIWLVDIEDYHK